MNAVPGAYQVRPAELDRERDTVLAEWKKGLGHGEYAAAIFEWVYRDNPAGMGTIFLLCTGSRGEVVGTQGISPRLWVIRGEQNRAGVFGDFVVDQRHRSLGPALTLLRETVRRSSDDFFLLYGFPNRRAAPVYLRSGYKKFGEFTRYSKVLRSRHYLESNLPTWIVAAAAATADWGLRLDDYLKHLVFARNGTGTWTAKIDERFDRLWARIDKDNLAMGTRTAEFLRWRFIDKPGDGYEVFVLASRDGQELDGYVVCHIDNSGFVSVQDILAADLERTFFCLLSTFVRAARRRGCKAISAEFLGPQRAESAFKSLHFKARSQRDVYCIKSAVAEQATNGSDWYLTAADEDQ